ncbi:MAG: hypothetical protein IPN70_04650 [Candidatus Moraniibacteriota bacterium]|nr:MAG: hypothetical protein IPN70_04650 [Candidatus Moranbacteria bacterium]
MNILHYVAYPFVAFFEGFYELWTGGERLARENLLLSTLSVVAQDRESFGDLAGAGKCYTQAHKIYPEGKFFHKMMLENSKKIQEKEHIQEKRSEHTTNLRILNSFLRPPQEDVFYGQLLKKM